MGDKGVTDRRGSQKEKEDPYCLGVIRLAEHYLERVWIGRAMYAILMAMLKCQDIGSGNNWRGGETEKAVWYHCKINSFNKSKIN